MTAPEVKETQHAPLVSVSELSGASLRSRSQKKLEDARRQSDQINEFLLTVSGKGKLKWIIGDASLSELSKQFREYQQQERSEDE